MNVQKAKVLGIRLLDFTNDQGEKIHGYQVWVSLYSGEPEWTKGVQVVKVWCKAGTDDFAKAQALLPDDELEYQISIKGKVRFIW